MGLKAILTSTSLANYGKAIRTAPREVIFSRWLILTSIVYATSAVPATWDQGSASTITSLPGFQKQFGISSGTNAKQGAALSFFLNDRIGRLWSFRLYVGVWIVGQLTATLTPGVPGLYVARIISGIGIGSLTVTGPMSLAEIAPAEIRGLITSWFTILMGMSLVAADFCTYGVYLNIPTSKLQYQVVWFSPCVCMFFCVVASFFLCESPRWLIQTGRRDEAVKTLVLLRALPVEHPRVAQELLEIEQHHALSIATYGDATHNDLSSICKETFTVLANLRRVQQVLLSYALAQLSGANSITNYLIPILKVIGLSGNTQRNLFLSGIYAVSKLGFIIIASFLLIDILGRRKSLFVGITLQLVSDVYIGVYTKYNQIGEASEGAGKAGTAALFIHALGYAIGLFILSYVFGAELWPNRIRSFGGALGATFHWLFSYAFSYALPSLLESTNNWGAFIFFAAICFLALIYVFLTVPETSGLSLEQLNEVFEGPWYNAYKRVKVYKNTLAGVPNEEDEEIGADKSGVRQTQSLETKTRF